MKNFLTCILSLGSVLPLAAVEKLPLSKDYWKSDAFVKEFNGSYRINASIEPYVTSEQRAELVAMQKLMAQGKRKQVITKLKASAELKKSAALQFNLANVLTEEAQIDKAITHYTAAIKILPSFRRAHQNVAYCYVQKNDWKKAFPHLLKAVELGSQDGSVLGLLGYAYQEQAKYQAALQAFRNAQLTQPESMDWKQGVAYALHQTGQKKQALTQYIELVSLKPEARYQLQLASLYLELDKQDKAMVKLDLLRRQKQLSAKNAVLLGSLYIEAGSVKVGGRVMKQAIAETTTPEADIFLQAVRTCIDRSLYPLAKDLHLMLAKKSFTDGQKRRYQRFGAELLLTTEKTREEGVAQLEKLVSSDPLDSHSLYLLAMQYKVEKTQEALLLFEQAIQSEGSHSTEALLEKAKLYVQRKQYAKAIAQLKKYLKLKKDPHVQQYLRAVEGVAKANTIDLGK